VSHERSFGSKYHSPRHKVSFLRLAQGLMSLDYTFRTAILYRMRGVMSCLERTLALRAISSSPRAINQEFRSKIKRQSGGQCVREA